MEGVPLELCQKSGMPEYCSKLHPLCPQQYAQKTTAKESKAPQNSLYLSQCQG